MDESSLDWRAISLLDELTSNLRRSHGSGCMSVAIYDTAWVSLVTKRTGSDKTWLFPHAFDYVLGTQLEDGSWTAYASQIDGILNTAASLLSILRHAKEPLQITSDNATITASIERATTALQRLLDSWDVSSTVHVGFEILVPAVLKCIEDENVSFTFPQQEILLEINQQKLKKFEPEYLYGKYQLTALHSLEAFIGKLDFDKVAHHKVNGSFMASPSSTAAYLIHASTWDDQCEAYLRHVLAYGAGQGSGGAPSAFPSTIFELTWALSTLLEGGFDFTKISPFHATKAASFLEAQLAAGKGAVGFAPGLGADADDTAKSMLILRLLKQDVSIDPLLQHFESDAYFKTYPLERDPSFSANCNVLAALLHAAEPAKYSSQIEKVVKFLLSVYQDHGLRIRDKWNISPLYSLMLLAQAGGRIMSLVQQGVLSTLPSDMIGTTVPEMLAKIFAFTISSQNENGSWGAESTLEETAYALLILSTGSGLPHPQAQSASARAMEIGRHYLTSTKSTTLEYLWVEKVTYTSKTLRESYTLAALKSTEKFMPTDQETINGQPTTKVVNGTAKQNLTINRHHKFDSAVAFPSDVVTRYDSNVNASDGNTVPATLTSWSIKNEKIVLGPYDYLKKQPGKDLRTLFIAAFNEWLQVPLEKLKAIQEVVRMLHTSSLLVDDIEDNSDLRRGRPVAHSIFGTAQTFNSANYVYFLALEQVRKLNNTKATDVFVEELVNLHRGQGMELFWRDSLICPTEAEYIAMASNKTGGLFRLAVRLLQVESPTGRDCLPLVNLLGLQFQVCDDFLNLMSTTYTANKGLCEDLTEGKFSFPIIHSIHADEWNKELLGILKQKTKAVDVKKYAVEYMRSTGSFEYTRAIVKDLGGKAERLVREYEEAGWGDGSSVRKLLQRMSLD
ncbi:hypothetical protein LTR78_000150 [Recurvomyces mirabilis]|uniref:Uncharacterized protein n=1 Tax=Recurvomyces mirabilis TaxID=574656 RepID=A0AAE1C6B4_9PEZI|nr:hypothetical protein LTR78_000150 [Recurvomyces mirabilis]KAK5161807.1 hypothetical protein LTS14_000152 [Recurvomyces mirabilis]